MKRKEGDKEEVMVMKRGCDGDEEEVMVMKRRKVMKRGCDEEEVMVMKRGDGDEERRR